MFPACIEKMDPVGSNVFEKIMCQKYLTTIKRWVNKKYGKNWYKMLENGQMTNFAEIFDFRSNYLWD